MKKRIGSFARNSGAGLTIGNDWLRKKEKIVGRIKN